ncbi:hypothetical protein [Agrobacterium tumefaciens]|uniref:hypothetical protein n=1 Tax=Agrobacterium tumefaciens TaxID=358 RepID=UPI0021D1A09D|nr:hypothetical protein [Agrobacterium tumefaciens]UXT27226.1 hypothetical protein FY139_16730 [Agrobacterium tumefaciens]UXT33174.1 hypothetical protein FY138_07055 [Agrobacterium tumefaciens]
MNRDEIVDLFIKGSTIEKRLPSDFVRPDPLRAQSIPYIHTEADMRGWFAVKGRTRSERIANRKKEGDQQEDGDLGRYVEERMKLWDPDHQRLEATDVSDWERRFTLIAMVSVEKNRRALWAWSKAKAGWLPFTKWCKREGIHEMTGQRRKDKAIAELVHLLREGVQHSENGQNAVLPLPPVFWHVSDNIAANAPKEEKTVHREEDARPMACYFDSDLTDFDWAIKQNAKRKQREERRKEEEARKREAA